MIGFRINEEFLELDEGTSIQMDLNNPLFNQDFEKGSLTYDITAPKSPKNQRLLKFAGSLSVRSHTKEALSCQMWLQNQLWRVGKLRVLEASDKYKFNFQSDAGTLDTLSTDKLRAAGLGTAPLTASVKSLDDPYALVPVLNNAFYKEGGNGYMNLFSGENHMPPLIPMPYLVDIIRKVLDRYGYAPTGAWLEEVATRRRVIYNVIEASGIVELNRHVPDLFVADFLKAIRKRYGLGLVFDTKGKYLHLVRLQDALDDPAYDDWTSITQQGFSWQPNTTDGFILKDALDSNDELQKDVPDDFGTWTFGNGLDPIETGIGSMAMHNGFPEVKQPGSSYADEKEAKFAFRVLQYLPGDVPAGTAETWDELAPAHRDWLAWRSETEAITRQVNLATRHLLMLNPLRKVMISSNEGTLKAFWERIELTLNMKGEIKAKAKFLKVMQ